jgi:hypothetical protein
MFLCSHKTILELFSHIQLPLSKSLTLNPTGLPKVWLDAVLFQIIHENSVISFRVCLGPTGLRDLQYEKSLYKPYVCVCILELSR